MYRTRLKDSQRISLMTIETRIACALRHLFSETLSLLKECQKPREKPEQFSKPLREGPKVLGNYRNINKRMSLTFHFLYSSPVFCFRLFLTRYSKITLHKT